MVTSLSRDKLTTYKLYETAEAGEAANHVDPWLGDAGSARVPRGDGRDGGCGGHRQAHTPPCASWSGFHGGWPRGGRGGVSGRKPMPAQRGRRAAEHAAQIASP